MRSYNDAISRVASVNPDMIKSKREELLAALSQRAIFEAEHNSGEKTAAQLARYYDSAVKIDAFMLQYAVAADFDFIAQYNSGKTGTDKFNIYAISKTWDLFRVLRGGAWGDVAKGNGGTLLGVCKALLAGQTFGKAIEGTMLDYLNSFPRKQAFGSGANTQRSSSLRALVACGIAREVSFQHWEVSDAPALQRLCEAGGLIASAPVSAPASALEAPADDAGMGDSGASDAAPSAPENAPAKRAKKARAK